MPVATFIGIDLAWRSHNPTGAAVLKGDRAGARLEVVRSLSPGDSIPDFIRSHATDNTIVAVDAPLIIVNQTGQRQCETEIGKRYGSREASCHTSNLTLYKDASSVSLTRQLLAEGFVHANPEKEQEGKIVAEVYPHAAMVALWDLPKTIKYKKGKVEQRLKGLENVAGQACRVDSGHPHSVSISPIK